MVTTVGVIGTGNIGSDHVRRLATRVSGARVGAVYDVDAERAGGLAASVGAAVHRQAHDVIDDAAVDAVLIASPGDTHAELALACISAGKPVLCEKPLATVAEEALKVVEAEVNRGRQLVQVGFMRRYDSGYRQVKAVLDGGQVGDALILHCVHRNPEAPPGFTSEMVLTDSVVHEIDTARWLLGQEITAATVVRPRRSPLVEGMQDPQLVLLETETGAVVEVEAFVNCRYGYDVRCEIVGSSGTVSLDTPQTGTIALAGSRSYPVPADWRSRFAQAYADELQEWVDGLGTPKVGGASAWDGYAATVVARSCVESLTIGARTQVLLADRPTFYS